MIMIHKIKVNSIREVIRKIGTSGENVSVFSTERAKC